MPTYEDPEEEEIVEAYDPDLQAPDGDYWCRFGSGLACLNGDRCKNKKHRKKEENGEEPR